jgi:hypothetical protein
VSVRSDEKTVYYGETFTDEINLRMEIPEAEAVTEEVPKQQETVEPDKRIDEFRELINDMKN